jgi:flagellar basal-body rod protein FlgG
MSSIRAAGAGLRAQEDRLAVISDNMANVQTVGFKSSRPEFSDLLRQQLPYGNAEARGNSVGTGAGMIGSSRTDQQGTLQSTGRSLDMAINGHGYFMVQRQDGQTAYTRDGGFQVDSLGRMVTGDGALITPNITIPPGSKELSISPQGQVSVKLGNGQIQTVGQIQLATFANDAGLSGVGHNQFQPSAASGPAQVLPAGQNGVGSIQQGALEQSTADLGDEMSQLIDAQRSFSMLTRVITTADQMESITNELTR